MLDRDLDTRGIYPPVSVLPSLSRLMKDGIGAGYTRDDHSMLSNQLFASYAKVQDAKALASVIGEDELSAADKQLMEFGRVFEQRFINQAIRRTAPLRKRSISAGSFSLCCRASSSTVWMKKCSISTIKAIPNN